MDTIKGTVIECKSVRNSNATWRIEFTLSPKDGGDPQPYTVETGACDAPGTWEAFDALLNGMLESTELHFGYAEVDGQKEIRDVSDKPLGSSAWTVATGKVERLQVEKEDNGGFVVYCCISEDQHLCDRVLDSDTGVKAQHILFEKARETSHEVRIQSVEDSSRNVASLKQIRLWGRVAS